MPGIESGLTDVALRGLEAARLLVDRFVEAVERLPGDGDEASSDAARPTEDVARAWASVLRTTADAWQGVATGHGTGTPSPLVGGQPGTVVALRLSPGEATATTELWVHNPTNEPVEDVKVVVGSLTATDGHVVAGAVDAEPAHLGSLPARTSRSVSLTVDLPPTTPAGRYRGLVLVDGIADTWAVLDVTLEAPP